VGPEHVEQAAEHRAGDHGHVEGRGGQGDGLAEILVRHQVAQHGLRGRHHEGARAAEQHQHREHRPHHLAAAEGKGQQQGAHQQLHQHAQHDDLAPVVAVGDVAGPQDQHQEGGELGQADQPEVEQAAGNLVDLPANGDALHLDGQGTEETCGKVEGEVAVAQDAEAGAWGQQRHGRRHITGKKLLIVPELKQRCWSRDGCVDP
jgi:hypothetical protein